MFGYNSIIFSMPSSVFNVNIYLKPKGFLVLFVALWGIINIDSILSSPGIGNLLVQPVKNINNDIAKKEGLKSVLLTFDPHPRHVIYPDDQELRLIYTIEEKIDLILNPMPYPNIFLSIVLLYFDVIVLMLFNNILKVVLFL